MPDLIAKSALSAQPLTIGLLRLAEAPFAPVTAIALYPGQSRAVAKLLKPLGLTFPAPNTLSQQGEAVLAWTGRDQAFLIGVAAPDMPPEVAAVTDQTDAWARLTLEGPGAQDALMRWVPLDLRPERFAVGSSVRAPVYHMQAVILRLVANRYDVMVFRSMARTAWHELSLAMTTIEARAARAG